MTFGWVLLVVSGLPLQELGAVFERQTSDHQLGTSAYRPPEVLDPRHSGSPGSWWTSAAKFSVNLGRACEIKEENSSVTIKFLFRSKSVTNTIDKTLSHDDGQKIYGRYSKQWGWSNDKKAILSQHYKLASKTNQNWGLTVLAHAEVQQDYKSKIYPKEPSV